MKPNPILCGPRVSDMILNSRLYKNVLNMKALLFHKFKNICTLVQYKDNTLDKEYIVSLFLYIGTIGEKAIQSCEYYIVPRPCKGGLTTAQSKKNQKQGDNRGGGRVG